jgi:hypothetical protein
MPIEAATDHRCRLGKLTDELASRASRGEGSLAERARAALRELLAGNEFDECCVPAYLALAPERFDVEIQVPVASAEAAKLDTRVLLWPIGAKDRDHPHRDGWAAFAVVRGDLAVSEDRAGKRLPERRATPRRPEVLRPGDGVRHHIHNRGDVVGLTIHVFGS